MAMALDDHSSVAVRRKTKPSLISKLAASQELTRASMDSSWSRNDLADKLQRQNLVHTTKTDSDGEYHSDDDKKLGSRRSNGRGSSSSRRSAPRGNGAADDAKGEKRNREVHSGESESDPDLRRTHASKRPSSQTTSLPLLVGVKVETDDDDEADNPRSGRTPRSSRPSARPSSHPTSRSSSRTPRGVSSVRRGRSDDEGGVEDVDAAIGFIRSSSRAKNLTNPDKQLTEYRLALEQLEDESADSVPNLRPANGGGTYRQTSSALPAMAGALTDFRVGGSGWGNISAMSESGWSERSSGSGSVMVQLSTKEARGRSFLVGSSCAHGPMLGVEELERYFPERTLRLFVGTYNMCEMREPPDSLNDFLLPELSELAQDVYVIGSQETIANKQEWELKIQETLGPQYVLLHSASHGTLHLVLFLRRDLIWFCSVTEEANVTTRPGPSAIRTKGAVGVSLQFFGTTFLFINSHFTAHDGKSLERVEDYKKIIAGLTLPRTLPLKPQYAAAADVTARFDCVFWMGDLNSRLERDRQYVEQLVLSLEASKQPHTDLVDYAPLVALDELIRLMEQERSFRHFQEGRIKFRPTYKYDVGSTVDIFDTSSKMRTPSYTDRVLYRTRTKNAVACVMYDSVPSIRDSDHKPVYALFEVSLRPGLDTIPLSGGQFNREVWVEGNRRRSMKIAVASRLVQKSVKESKLTSNVCSVM